VKLHELKPAPGSRKKRTRVGRGISAGQGKTSGRGMKGQGSRESNSVPKGFEGGQMKASMRLPKLRGFHNRFRKEYAVVNLSKLNRFAKDSIVDGAALAAAGLVSGAEKPVKLLAAGRVRVAVQVRVHRASAAAQKAVAAAGGRVDLLEEPAPPDVQATDRAAARAAGRASARAAAADARAAEPVDTAPAAVTEPDDTPTPAEQTADSEEEPQA
jgi:large subunit ribosomal protein L15